MQDMKSHMGDSKCPSFYKEKIKNAKKPTTLQILVRRIVSIFSDK